MTVSLQTRVGEFDAQVKGICNELRMIPVDKDAWDFPLVYMLNSAKLNKDLGKGGYLVASLDKKNCSVEIDGVWKKKLCEVYKWAPMEAAEFCKRVARFTAKRLKPEINKIVHVAEEIEEMSAMAQGDTSHQIAGHIASMVIDS